MLIFALVLLALGGVGLLVGHRLWDRHRWQPWCDLAVIVCLILGTTLALVAPTGEGGSRGVYFEPDASR